MTLKKILAAAFLVTLITLITVISAFGNELIEVTVKARGATQEEALASAVDEAIRRSVGALFAENTQLKETGTGMLEEKLIQFSRGTATNYKILETSSDEAGVAMTVLVTVDFTQLRDNARTVKEGTTAGGMGYRQTPGLEHGQRLLTDLMHGIKYENFLEAGLQDQQVDIRKGLLNVTAFLRFNRERYAAEFAGPMAKVMAEIFAPSGLSGEIEGEYENSQDRYAAFFHVLGENYSSGVWTLPRGLYETLKRDARFWDARNGRVQTHKRVWLHFSLLDKQGTEIERLPVHLAVSNVLFFSETRREPSTPLFFMGMETSGLKSAFTLTAAPYFGAMTNQGYEFHENFTQPFAFKLPEALLTQVTNVKITLELER